MRLSDGYYPTNGKMANRKFSDQDILIAMRVTASRNLTLGHATQMLATTANQLHRLTLVNPEAKMLYQKLARNTRMLKKWGQV